LPWSEPSSSYRVAKAPRSNRSGAGDGTAAPPMLGSTRRRAAAHGDSRRTGPCQPMGNRRDGDDKQAGAAVREGSWAWIPACSRGAVPACSSTARGSTRDNATPRPTATRLAPANRLVMVPPREHSGACRNADTGRGRRTKYLAPTGGFGSPDGGYRLSGCGGSSAMGRTGEPVTPFIFSGRHTNTNSSAFLSDSSSSRRFSRM